MIQGDELKSLGIGGILLYLILREMFSYLKEKSKGANDEHPVKEPSGEAVCKTLESAVMKLTVNMEMQTRLMERIIDKLDRIHEAATARP